MLLLLGAALPTALLFGYLLPEGFYGRHPHLRFALDDGSLVLRNVGFSE